MYSVVMQEEIHTYVLCYQAKHICINTIHSLFLFVFFVYSDCLRVIAPVEEVPVSQGSINNHMPVVVTSDPPAMNTLPQQSSVTGPTPASTGMYTVHMCSLQAVP